MNSATTEHFDHQYQRHLKHLKLKGLQRKTIEAYSRAVRRAGDTFAYQIDDLTVGQLTDYFSDRVASHSWSTVKPDLYGLKFYYEHVLRKPWVASGLINISGTEMLAISFRRRTTDQLVAVATSSTDLASWSGPAATPVPGTTLESKIPDGTGFEVATYRLHDSLANAPRAFLRAEYSFP